MEDSKLPSTLQDTLVSSLPDSGYYIPNFITPTEESYILSKVSSASLDQKILTNEVL